MGTTATDPVRRYEINRKTKAVLTRHAVDLTQLQYSAAGETIHLFGRLAKEPKGDFTAAQIETLVRDLAAVPEVRDVQFEVTNWAIGYEPGAINIRAKR